MTYCQNTETTLQLSIHLKPNEITDKRINTMLKAIQVAL